MKFLQLRVIGAQAALLSSLAAICTAAIASAGPSLPERSAAELQLSRFSLQRLGLAPAPEAASVRLDLDGESVTVRLRRATLRSPDFRLLVQGADGLLTEVAPPAPATYRGTVDGKPGAIVTGTIRHGQLTATVALEDGPVFYVEPMGSVASEADAALHFVYRGDAVAAGTETCAADGAPVAVERRDVAQPEAAGSLRVADLAFDADVEFYKLNQSRVDSTVRDIEKVMTGVNAVYERDAGLTHRIVTVIVRTAENDPYSATTAESLYTQFKNHWNASQTGISRDIAHLMTGKSLSGNTIGYASIGAVCSGSRGFGISRSRYSSNFSRRLGLTAHELGHNWNASHCNGNIPCHIMCSTIAGCDGLGQPNFEPQGQSTILAYSATRTCLGTLALDVGGPAATGVRLENPWPSPLLDHTRVSFYLDRAGPVRLSVHDLAGRRIATLVEGVGDQGRNEVAWDGRDLHGRKVEPGALFLRLETERGVLSRKLLVIQ